MRRIFNVCEPKENNVLVTLIFHNEKMAKAFLKSMKVKKLNVYEVFDA